MIAARARRMLWRIGSFGLLWGVLTRFRVDALPLGMLTVAMASGLSLWLGQDRARLRWYGAKALHLAGLILWDSLRGGFDIARRAFKSPIPLRPAVIDHPLRIPPGAARIVLADVLSLVPGSLVIRADDNGLRVHLCDDTEAFRAQLAIEEQRLMRALALSTPGE